MDDREDINPGNIQEAFADLVAITRGFADMLSYKEWLDLLDYMEDSKTNVWTHVDPILLLVIGGRELFKNKNFENEGLEKFLLGGSLYYFKDILTRIGQGLRIPFNDIPIRMQEKDKIIKNILTYRLKVGK